MENDRKSPQVRTCRCDSAAPAMCETWECLLVYVPCLSGWAEWDGCLSVAPFFPSRHLSANTSSRHLMRGDTGSLRILLLCLRGFYSRAFGTLSVCLRGLCSLPSGRLYTRPFRGYERAVARAGLLVEFVQDAPGSLCHDLGCELQFRLSEVHVTLALQGY